MRTQTRCSQTPHGSISYTCCLSGTMHSAYTVWRQLNAYPLVMLPSRDDVHRHRVLTARCTRRSEDRNRLVAFTKHILPSRDDVHRHRVLAARCTRRGEDLNRMVAYPNKSCPPGTMCTDTVWWQPHAHSEAKIAIAWWHNTRTYAAHQGRCAQTPYGGSRTHTQRRRSQSHGAVPKWLIRLANPLRFSGPARPRDDKKNKRIK